MLENCKRLICSPSLNKVYCIALYCYLNKLLTLCRLFTANSTYVSTFHDPRIYVRVHWNTEVGMF